LYLKLINTDSNITFSQSFCLNSDKNFFFNYPVLHKTLSGPYIRPTATLFWVTTLGWESLDYVKSTV